jgi:hypothetical protein
VERRCVGLLIHIAAVAVCRGAPAGEVVELALGPASGCSGSARATRRSSSSSAAFSIAGPNVGCPCFKRYFSTLLGAKLARGGHLSGIRTPDSHTLVLQLTAGRSGTDRR